MSEVLLTASDIQDALDILTLPTDELTKKAANKSPH